jgi:DNA-binding NarL/FixJ family response regulator
MTTRTVLIIDSHDIVRFALETLVLGCRSLSLLGSAETLAAGLRVISDRQPDLVITDMTLRDSHGLETVRAVVAAQQPRHTLVVSMHDELLYGEQVLGLGANGYVMKDTAQANVIAAALAVLEGQRWTSPALSSHIVKRVLQRRRQTPGPAETSLTVRELEVLEQLKTGKSTKQIAAALHISPRTVDLYRAQIKKKLGLRTGAELIAFASHHL